MRHRVEMTLTTRIKHRTNDFLRQHGFEIVPSECLYEWQRATGEELPRYNSAVPQEAAGYLTPDNPNLLELEKRYRAFGTEVTTPSVWRDGYVSAADIACFRGDNAWVWQVRGKNANILAYALSFYYLRSIDRLGLLDKLTEDETFGNFVFRINGRQVSRDLLDSISEIYFLDRHLGLGLRSEGLRVLDIGAGYGRLAHRMANALGCIDRYYCTDAVAVSTFVSGYYLHFRNVDKAVVTPLDEIEAGLRVQPVDLAVNIHSFSECRMEAIEWWVRLLAENRVRHLMIVPNSPGGKLLTNDGEDFLPLLERHSYRLRVSEPKYLDPVVQEFGLYPAWHHLLELAV